MLTRETRNVTILAFCQMLFIIAAITSMTLGGVIGLKLSENPTHATLPIGLMMLGTVVSTLPASLLMVRIGRRRGFILGVILGGITGGLLSVVSIAIESFSLFCIGHFLLGIYQGFAMYYRFAALDVAADAFKSRALSLVLSGGVAAAFLGPWNASALINWIEAIPYSGPYLMIAVHGLLAALFLTKLDVPNSGEPDFKKKARPLKEIIVQPIFIVALTTAALGYTIMILLMSATPLAMQALNFNMNSMSHVMICHVLGMFAPSFFTGTLIARFGLIPIIFHGCLLLITSVIITQLGHDLIHFIIALVLLGIGWNFVFVASSHLLSTIHTEEERGKVQGINDLVIFSSVTIGSLATGHLLHWFNWKGINLLMLPLILIMIVSLGWLLKYHQKN
jgi:MFS family permease